jgi:hypothetical protein
MATVSEQPPPEPTIHEATRLFDGSGAVEWGREITVAQAAERRRAGLDIVVRGDDVDANRRRAREIDIQPKSEEAQPQSEEVAMKFFTPDLFHRFGSTDDAIASAAQTEWEHVDQQYREHLRQIRAKLPRGAKSLLRNFCLHDARLLAVGTREDGLEFSLFLELNTPQREGILLTYDLLKRPKLVKHPALAEKGTPLEWLYDEFDVKGGTHPSFKHSILFTGGRELGLTFRHLRLAVFERVLVPTVEQEGNDLYALLAG